MSYTQNNEEGLILNYFSNRNQSELTVLDIGANDGKTFSNSLKVIEMGWNAVLIEPTPKALALLASLHSFKKNVMCFPIAITNQNGMFQLQESSSLLNQGDTSLVSSLKQEETVKWANNNVRFNTVNVMGMDFNSFLETSPYKKFNLISIDVEGYDYDVLSQIDLMSIGCEMLIIEFNGKDESLFTSYANKFGMKLISKNPENLIFTK
ncbi:MAG: FkbM family methyltransferase [Gammaproteobacteria bacterium]